MSLTPAMKQMLRDMTPAQLQTMVQTAIQPRITIDMPSNRSHGKVKKRNARAAPHAKATRPLNSFIAFRSYYSAAFPKCQQKEISGFLTNLWQFDPYKAKWSLLAKAYSVIRDSQGKDNVRLDHFLAFAGPLMGMIEPQHYLQTMGWEIIIQEGGQVIKRHDVQLNERTFISNLSVNDIIRQAHKLGFFTGNIAELLLSENEVVMTMAASTQRANAPSLPMIDQIPTHVAQALDEAIPADFGGNGDEQNARKDSTNKNVTQKGEFANAMSSSSKAIEEQTTSAAVNTFMAEDASMEATQYYQNLEVECSTQANEDTAVVDEPNLTYNTISPASDLAASNFQLTSSYPYNAEFEPNASSFVFDPFFGNQFDAFDMSAGLTWLTSMRNCDSRRRNTQRVQYEKKYDPRKSLYMAAEFVDITDRTIT
ncbi:hypothetical protein ACLMJK_009014 [Lecanora helva]